LSTYKGGRYLSQFRSIKEVGQKDQWQKNRWKTSAPKEHFPAINFSANTSDQAGFWSARACSEIWRIVLPGSKPTTAGVPDPKGDCHHASTSCTPSVLTAEIIGCPVFLAFHIASDQPC
jgi:hypothetical protein